VQGTYCARLGSSGTPDTGRTRAAFFRRLETSADERSGTSDTGRTRAALLGHTSACRVRDACACVRRRRNVISIAIAMSSPIASQSQCHVISIAIAMSSPITSQSPCHVISIAIAMSSPCHSSLGTRECVYLGTRRYAGAAVAEMAVARAQARARRPGYDSRQCRTQRAAVVW
jgi:hypothetical protein